MRDFLYEFFSTTCSILIALLRLMFLTAAMLTSSVHVILFTRTEVCSIDLKGMPLRCDRERDMQNLSFIDKVCLQNPDLLDYADDNSDTHYPENGEDNV